MPRSWADAWDNFHYTRHDLSHLTSLREDALLALLAGTVDERPEVADGDLCIAVPEAASRAVERFFPPLGLPKVRVFLTRGNF
ncbi:MAG: hypothetical protein WBJ68_08755 [Candidatus Dechloromonas phosphoritropha]